MAIAVRVLVIAVAMLAPLAAATLDVEGRLLKATVTPMPEDVRPYPRALCTYLYKVEKVHAGEYAPDRILVVKWAIWNKAVVEGLPEKVGAVERMNLDPWIDYPGFRTQRIVDGVKDRELVIYYDVDSRPAGLGDLPDSRSEELKSGVVRGETEGWLFLAEELRHAKTGRF